VLKHVREVSPSTFVIVTTAYASVESAVNALRLGAQDYILKPILFDDLLKKIQRLLEYKTLAWEIQMLRRETQRCPNTSDLVGDSPAIKEILALCQKVASADSTVLITGESGVGKEVVARLIHAQSPRGRKMFLPINCSAIPDTLLESQLFGYVRGAFTGASSSSEGLFQRARGGTIFLDEIGDLSETLQPKLLRVIETKEVLPIGAMQPARTDVRLIAATHQDLKQAVDEKQFREDLYYRLNVINIHIPPLRERREDIAPLVNFLIGRHNANLKKNYKGADSAAMRVLMSLPWKGNIRELDNVLERAMILGDGEWIAREYLPNAPEKATDGRVLTRPHDLKSALMAYERMHIENVLKETRGNKGAAAQLLGLSRSSLYRKLDSLGFEKYGGNGDA
ncbi:MAG TPA: sigma-54 dependent transcriptional regulator, partial [Terriglobales bacterium]|nr:sigma-54 dependent transcriptional regulator [Terriglobales bacterium]